MPKLRILISETFDPWFNLATEEWIFRDMDPSVQTLFLWRNQHTVVIGRNQNPWTECNLRKMEEDGIKLARRTSGGGAVYHDLGNTCFTFLSPRDGYDRSTNSNIILKALKDTFGIVAEASGRNDLIVQEADGPKKFSGCAFRETRDRAFHHGTVLMSADLTKLGQYLTPHPKKMLSKGRASVRARVMNLQELAPSISHDTLVPAVIKAFCEHYGSTAEPEILNPENLAKLPGLQERFEENSTWDWRFGHTPQFQQQLNEYLTWGFVDVFLDTEHAKITRLELYSDSLFPSLIESLQTAMVGMTYSKQGMRESAAKARAQSPEYELEILEFENWMLSQLEI
jgi:lipoate-protein ligase A